MCRFIDLEYVYDLVEVEALWKVLRMNDVRGELLNGIRSMYDNSFSLCKTKWRGIGSFLELIVV